jgi:riboflavin transporter FmnP
MSRNVSRSYFVVSTAILSALAILFDVMSDVFPLRTPWGMKIDFVGVIWVLAYFLYGVREALSVSIITAIFISIVMPTGFLGAMMKLIATLPMFVIPALISQGYGSKKRAEIFNNIIIITIACILATVVRLIVATFLNLYWAIPLYLNIPQEEVLNTFGGWIALVSFVAGFNVLQGIVDILVSWVLAFKFKLSGYFGTW